MRVAESRLLRWVDFRVEDLVVVGIFIITFGNMLRIRIGKVWEYIVIFLLKQSDENPTTTKKFTRYQPNEEAWYYLLSQSLQRFPFLIFVAVNYGPIQSLVPLIWLETVGVNE